MENISNDVIVVNAHITKNNLVVLYSKQVRNAIILRNMPSRDDEMWIEM